MRQKEQLKSISPSLSDKYKIQNCVFVCMGAVRESKRKREREEKKETWGWIKGNENLDLSSACYIAGDVQSNKSSYINSVNPHKIQCSECSITSIWQKTQETRLNPNSYSVQSQDWTLAFKLQESLAVTAKLSYPQRKSNWAGKE